jgi:hypothetical protein
VLSARRERLGGLEVALSLWTPYRVRIPDAVRNVFWDGEDCRSPLRMHAEG